MKIKTFPLVLAITIIASVGAIVGVKLNSTPEPSRPGIEQSDHGREHVKNKDYDGDQPPTSGPHADPVEWGAYTTEVSDVRAIHNLEHGGIYVSYRPDLPKDQLGKLKKLLFAPFSDRDFQPKKIVLAPRAANKGPIILSSWRRSETLTKYDEQKIQDYVSRNLGKSPEPLAR